MPAYVVADLEVIDNEKYEVYKKLVPPSLQPFGGRFIVRGGSVQILDGEWSPKRLVIIEFPSMEKAKAWANSPEYAEAKAMRQASANSKIIAVEGL
jgi:uncharacterized protein (DUF1330 family)